MRNKFNIDDFLDLQKQITAKIHFRDACGMSVIEVENNNEDIKKEIIKFFESRNISVEFSKDDKYVYGKK